MTLPDHILGLNNADWPGWVQVVVGLAVLAAVVAVSSVFVRGITWLLFGDWFRAIGTSAVLAGLVWTGYVSIDGTWSWVQRQWVVDSEWLTMAIIVLGAYPVWLLVRGIGAMWSSPAPRALGQPVGSRH